jgi:outer membrane lipoprotein carrier protein
MSRFSLVATLVVLLVTAITAQHKPAPDLLARELQQRYQTIRDFSADFVHSYHGGALRKTVTERGTMEIKKPGMMRWDYTAPEKKTFVSDGRKMYSYIPQDKQVIVTTLPPDEQAPTPMLFLAGKGDIQRDFAVSDAPGAPGTFGLKLIPKRPEADYESLTVSIDPTTLQIRGLATTDRQGGESVFTFSNLKENRGVSDKEFAFRIPRGVDVVTDDRVSR